MKKVILATLVIAMFVCTGGALAKMDQRNADKQSSTVTVYFDGGSATKNFASATSHIEVSTSTTLFIYCSTSTTIMYDEIYYFMRLQKKTNGVWSDYNVTAGVVHTSSYQYRSKTIAVSPGEYRVKTMHIIINPDFEDDVISMTGSVIL